MVPFKRKTKFVEDDRAQRIIDLVPELEGQINVSHVNSTKHIVAWHVHNQQQDYFTCLKGSFKIGVAIPKRPRASEPEDFNVEWFYISDKEPTTLIIPPGCPHGYKALEKGSILHYYLTMKYEAGDVYNFPVGYFGENWDIENK